MLRGTPDMYVGMSALHRERNDLGLARQLLARTEELGEHTGLPQNRHRWRIAMARVLEAEGDLDAALDLLDEAQRVYTPDFSPNVRPIPAIRARVLITQGRLDAALGWAREWGLSAADDLSYLREFEHITLARVLLARNAAEHDQPLSTRHPTAGTSPPGRRGRGPDGQRHRDPGAAGARPANARGRARRVAAAGTRPVAGRAGGLRPDVRRRGPRHGLAPRGGRETRDRARLRTTTPECIERGRGTEPRDAGSGRPAQPA